MWLVALVPSKIDFSYAHIMKPRGVLPKQNCVDWPGRPLLAVTLKSMWKAILLLWSQDSANFVSCKKAVQ